MIYDCDRTWWHLTCGNLWLPVTGISQAIICPVLMFFFPSGNISVNPHDYQLVKNENFSEWVSKGPHKMSGNPRICLVNTQFWPDTVLWPALTCSPVYTQ